MKVSLVMFSPAGERRSFRVPAPRAIIGRTGECDLQVQLSIISRRHCELMLKDEELSVRDLGSSNGTFVNGQRIQQAVLQPGDTLTVGPVVFTVVVDGNPAEIAPIKTILNGSKKKKAPHPTPMPTAATPNPADSGSIDLAGSTGMDILDDDDSDASHNPLAALEELSKQHKP